MFYGQGLRMLTEEMQAWITAVLERVPSLGEVWLIGSRASKTPRPDSDWDFMAFGDQVAYDLLAQAVDLHRGDVDFLVVLNGDDFRSAWSGSTKTGSLKEWQWKRISGNEAQYLAVKNVGDGAFLEVRCSTASAILLNGP